MLLHPDRLTLADGDALVFLNDYSDGFRLTPHDSEDEVPGQDGARQPIPSDISNDEESAVGADLTSASSAQNSPTGPTHGDGSLQSSRHRASTAGDSVKSRRVAGGRPRPTGHTGRVTSAMSSQHARELQHDMAMGTLNETMLRDTRVGIHQPHVGPGMMVGIPQQMSSNTFDGVLDYHRGGRDMTSCLPPQGLRQHGLSSQGWLGIVPNMGPAPLEQIYGVTPLIVSNQEMGHSFFGQIEHDMSSGMQNGLSLIDPPHYHDYGEGTQRSLPLRMVDAHPPGMTSQPDMKMDLMSSSFYRM